MAGAAALFGCASGADVAPSGCVAGGVACSVSEREAAVLSGSGLCGLFADVGTVLSFARDFSVYGWDYVSGPVRSGVVARPGFDVAPPQAVAPERDEAEHDECGRHEAEADDDSRDRGIRLYHGDVTG